MKRAMDFFGVGSPPVMALQPETWTDEVRELWARLQRPAEELIPQRGESGGPLSRLLKIDPGFLFLRKDDLGSAGCEMRCHEPAHRALHMLGMRAAGVHSDDPIPEIVREKARIEIGAVGRILGNPQTWAPVPASKRSELPEPEQMRRWVEGVEKIISDAKLLAPGVTEDDIRAAVAGKCWDRPHQRPGEDGRYVEDRRSEEQALGDALVATRTAPFAPHGKVGSRRSARAWAVGAVAVLATGRDQDHPQHPQDCKNVEQRISRVP